MDVLYPRCCGIDIHKKSITVCILIREPGRQEQKHIREFGTTTSAILSCGDWLRDLGVTHVAMESTGVYWRPIWNLLEGQFELLLANATHVKNVPGRKTDVKDSEWIAQLMQHGLLKPSFVPDTVLRDLRELSRDRTSLVAERSRLKNRIQKILASRCKNSYFAAFFQRIAAHRGRKRAIVALATLCLWSATTCCSANVIFKTWA